MDDVDCDDRSDGREDETNEDRSPLKIFLVKKLATVVVKLPDCGDLQDGVVTVGPGETSLVAVDVEFTDLGPTIPQFSHDRCAVVLAPGVGAGERMRQALEMSLKAPRFQSLSRASGRRTGFANEFP